MTGNEIYSIKFIKALKRVCKAVGKNSKFKDDIDVINSILILSRKKLDSIIAIKHTERRDDILKEISIYFNLPVDEIVSRNRRTDLLFARYLFMFSCKMFTLCSLTQIGVAIDRKHCDVIHGIKNGLPSMIKGNTRAEYNLMMNNFIAYLLLKYPPVLSDQVDVEAFLSGSEHSQQSDNKLSHEVLPSQTQFSLSEPEPFVD